MNALKNFISFHKKIRRSLLLIVSILLISISSFAQNDHLPEDDPVIVSRLNEWQDLKFGFMMHWGAYSQWSVVESWSICPEDEDWCSRNGADYYDYLKRYENLPATFNPAQFSPEQWAEAAYDAGMRYMVFTTKHHDGFCMFDTKETDYKITGSQCAFSSNPKADVTKEIFAAFRKRGFWIGAYFSKPDWHSPDYWSPQWTAVDRNVNYDPQKHPDLWANFRRFTYNQIEEIMSDYGKIDILWLDGGWVRPQWSLTEETRPWIGCHAYIQDIDMPDIAAMARRYAPELLIVDRTVHGKYENYQTPEQKVPESVLDYPWETCMSMATSWSYVENDTYKSTRELIHLLVDIVAKGGNLLLNVGPSPQGTLADTAYLRMQEIGTWMNVNHQAIYATRPVAPYKSNNICFTQSKTGTVFAAYLAADHENKMPQIVEFQLSDMKKITSVKLLGHSTPLSFERSETTCRIKIPKTLQQNPPCQYAWVFEIASE